MRTTVDVPEHLLAAAKQLAAATGRSFARIVEESLRAYLAEERGRARTPARALPIVRTAKPVRGIDLDDTSALLDVE